MSVNLRNLAYEQQRQAQQQQQGGQQQEWYSGGGGIGQSMQSPPMSMHSSQSPAHLGGNMSGGMMGGGVGGEPPRGW